MSWNNTDKCKNGVIQNDVKKNTSAVWTDRIELHDFCRSESIKFVQHYITARRSLAVREILSAC